MIMIKYFPETETLMAFVPSRLAPLKKVPESSANRWKGLPKILDVWKLAPQQYYTER